MRRAMKRRLAVAAMLTAVASGAANPAQTTQDETDCEAAAPTVVTLKQSAEDSSYAAVVHPNCTVVVLTPSASEDGTTLVDASSQGIEVVTGLPAVAKL